jgi:hypothetical protein
MKNKIIAAYVTLAAGVFTAEASLAQDVAGKYKYTEKGYTGTMIIAPMGPGFTFKFQTSNKSNGQMCDFETYETPIDQGGGRVNDDLPAHGGTQEDGVKFNIAFKKNTATIEVESKGTECGMSGYFGGTYVKVSK